MKFEVRQANILDAQYVARYLRAADRREAIAIAPRSSMEDLVVGSLLGSAESYAATLDDVPFIVGGVATKDGKTGHPWMLGTDAVKKHPVSVVRSMRRIVSGFREQYVGLTNWVDAENYDAIKVLQVLGFAVGLDAVRINGVGFLRFGWGEYT